MFFCSQCLEEMKPLFVGFFCPNDCDKKTETAKDHFYGDPMEAICRIISPVMRESFRERSRGRDGTWFAYCTGRGTWTSYHKIPEREILFDARIVLKVENHTITVIKSRYMEFSFEKMLETSEVL
jgi:hypothetical protein